MSDEQSVPKWGESIDDERKAELRAKLHEWNAELYHGERKGPFDDMRLTGGDVFWLCANAVAGLQGNVMTAEQRLRTHMEHMEPLDRFFTLNVLAPSEPPEAPMSLDLSKLTLAGANLMGAHLEGAYLADAHLEQVDLLRANLRDTDLGGTHLEGARLSYATLEGANLRVAHLEQTQLVGTNLKNADLRAALLDKGTRLNRTLLNGALLDQITLDNTNLTVIDWNAVSMMGDERTARTPKDDNDKPKDRDTRIAEFQAAVRANRQLAVALKAQGLDEDAGRFAYNAQLLQQQVLRRQRKFGVYVFSRFLDGLAGYGYKPVRGLIAYGLVIVGFMLIYMHFGVGDASCTITGMSTTGSLLATCSPAHTLTLREAFVFSLTSFHGRGFFPGGLGLSSPITLIAAFEAVIGLLIEISFIATFTQRFFGTK